MKYQCTKCSFQWEGTSYTFDNVREHEKTHLPKNENMSIRCKVCNTLKITKKLMSSNDGCECKMCGNLIDVQGRVITS